MDTDTVTQKQLAKMVAAMTGQPYKVVYKIILSFNEAIRSSLFNKKEVFLANIGRIYFKELKAAVYKTPTGHLIYSPNRYKPHMAFLDTLKRQIAKATQEAAETPDNDLPFEE